jgi:hypothetical protein
MTLKWINLIVIRMSTIMIRMTMTIMMMTVMMKTTVMILLYADALAAADTFVLIFLFVMFLNHFVFVGVLRCMRFSE